MKIAAIIQARMGSSRLPGKVMKKVLDKSLLEYQIERLQKSINIDEIIIAAPSSIHDQPIVDLGKKMNVKTFTGSETNVLERFYLAASKYSCEHIVRLTGDCPLIDPAVVDQCVSFYKANSYDYVSNTLTRTFPRGMDTEVFSFSLLEEAYDRASKDFEKEHVTPYFYTQKGKFNIGQFENKKDLSHLRLTVDTAADFRLVKWVIEKLYPIKPDFILNDIVELLNAHPEIIEINQHINQKKLGE